MLTILQIMYTYFNFVDAEWNSEPSLIFCELYNVAPLKTIF